jgi:DNA-directed RNA polymerase subunit RPC12/RpoP
MNTVDLMQFAGKGDPREYMRRPIPCAGGAFATNGHVMIFVPGATAEDPSPMPPKFVEVAEEYRLKALTLNPPAWTPAAALPLEGELQCVNCDGIGRISSRDCDECDGDGFFVHVRHEYSCQECQGEGVIETPTATEGEECPSCGGSKIQPEPVQLGDVTGLGISTRYLYQLRQLPDCELAWADNVIAFRFTGGCGVVMPMTGMRKRA